MAWKKDGKEYSNTYGKILRTIRPNRGPSGKWVLNCGTKYHYSHPVYTNTLKEAKAEAVRVARLGAAYGLAAR